MYISPSEKDYIVKGVQADIRNDGRGRLDCRPIYIETGILSHASGSARCRLGDGTDVLVGVKAETQQILPTSKSQDKGFLKITVECSPNSSQQFDSKETEEFNEELANILENTLCGPQGGIDLKKLCIIPGNACWCIFVDALILGIGGNLVDAISFAIYSALKDTRLPLTVVEEVGEGEYEFEVVDDDAQSIPLPGCENAPIITTLTKIGDQYAIDCNNMEELCGDVFIHVAVNPSGKICSIQKRGDHSLDPLMLLDILSMAQSIGTKALESLNKRLEEEQIEITRLKEQGKEIKKMGFLA